MDITNSLGYASSLAATANGASHAAGKNEEKKEAAMTTAASQQATVEKDKEAVETAVETTDVEEEESATGLDAKSILKDFKKAMDDQLLKSMGLGSTEELAAAMASAGISSLSISVQFELNYQSVSSISGAATGSSMSLSLSASFELTGISSGLGSNFNPFSTGSTQDTKGSDLISTLKDLFSPEKTAQRILDFSLGFFGQSSMFKESGDTEESRSEFADMMGKAIQKGFDQALGILGDLPKETASEVDQTHELVFQGLEDFIKNGRDNDKEDLYSQLQAYTSSYQYSMSYSSMSSTWNGGTQSSTSVNMQASYQSVQSSYGYGAGAAGSSGAEDVTA